MPPKKKGKAARAASIPQEDLSDYVTDDVPVSPESGSKDDSAFPDAWTDGQETTLLKAMIRWKPVGSSLIDTRGSKSGHFKGMEW